MGEREDRDIDDTGQYCIVIRCMDSHEGSTQVHAIEGRLVQCIQEKRYDDARIIGKDLLPLIAEEDRSVRLHIYHLLQRCPGFELSDIHRWNARVVTEDIMADRACTSEERIRAHILHLLLGSFSSGGSPPEGSNIAPSRRWLSRELRELYAEQAAMEILGRGGEGDRELRRDAHVVRCFTCPDHRLVEAHLEELFTDGDETAILQGCCGASEEFHAETACRFLHRALVAMTKEQAIARLLEYKLAVLLMLYMQGPGERTKESEEQYKALYRDFIATMTCLELCGGALLERAHGHVYFAILADWYGEEASAEIHCDIAKALAEQVQSLFFQQAVDECRSWILSEERDGAVPGEKGEEEQEKDDDVHHYEDDDEDDDDDDRADFWKGEGP